MGEPTKEEVKLLIDGQWFYRGNRSPIWMALASRSDGSPSGISEQVPREVWPILERVVALERHARTLAADLARAPCISDKFETVDWPSLADWRKFEEEQRG